MLLSGELFFLVPLMIITIDGPSGTGKSTIARRVADKLGFNYFDTGAMYRSAAYLILKNNIHWQDTNELKNFLLNFSFAIREINKEKHYFANNEDVTHLIRTPEISKFASLISALEITREAMVEKQRIFGKEGKAVFEGRDMGTVVFPAADVKFFLIATPEERAARRYKELLEKKMQIDLETVLQEVIERDHRDMTREISPLIAAKDAMIIDTTALSIEEVTDKVLLMIKQRFP